MNDHPCSVRIQSVGFNKCSCKLESGRQEVACLLWLLLRLVEPSCRIQGSCISLTRECQSCILLSGTRKLTTYHTMLQRLWEVFSLSPGESGPSDRTVLSRKEGRATNFDILFRADHRPVRCGLQGPWFLNRCWYQPVGTSGAREVVYWRPEDGILPSARYRPREAHSSDTEDT